MTISKRKRFDVFKRDGFKCQYCGKSAPDVVLHVDHVHPKSKGGDDSLLNLVTSCLECNLGKGPRTLDDQTAIEKERRQLEELNERREQLDMMLEWKRGLVDIDKRAADNVAAHFAETFGCEQDDSWIPHFQKLIRQFSYQEVLDAVEYAHDAYSDIDKALSKLGGILHIRKKSKTDPAYGTVCRIKARMRSKYRYIDENDAEYIIREAIKNGADYTDLSRITSQSTSWTRWCNNVFDAFLPETKGA